MFVNKGGKVSLNNRKNRIQFSDKTHSPPHLLTYVPQRKVKVRFKGNRNEAKVDHYTSVIDDESIPFQFTSPGV